MHRWINKWWQKDWWSPRRIPNLKAEYLERGEWKVIQKWECEVECVYFTLEKKWCQMAPHSFEWSKIGNLVIACTLKKNWDSSVKKLSSVSGIRRRLGGVGNHSKQSSSPVFFHWEGGGNGARTASFSMSRDPTALKAHPTYLEPSVSALPRPIPGKGCQMST